MKTLIKKSNKSQSKKNNGVASGSELDPSDLAAVAKTVTEGIVALGEKLPLDNDLVERSRKGANALKYMSTAALATGATVVQQHSDLFPSIDANELRNVAAFETALNEVALAATSLARSRS